MTKQIAGTTILAVIVAFIALQFVIHNQIAQSLPFIAILWLLTIAMMRQYYIQHLKEERLNK